MIDTLAGELRTVVKCDVHEPGDPGYDECCTLFNAAIERHPAAVVRVADTEDVAAAIAFASAQQLPLAIRSGGHSAAGWSLCDDGIVIDMRSIDGIEIDPAARTARVGGGCLTAQLDRAAQEHGLAAVTGRVSTTGMAGFTLGGGSGMLERQHGFAVDNLLAVELVTAAGEVVTADQHTHSELFWALRGGGGNFGVVTAMTFRLHPIPSVVTGGLMLWSAADAPALLRHLRAIMLEAPDHLAAWAAYLYAPDDESVPAHLRNQLGFVINVAHTGPVGTADRDLAPLRSFKAPEVDWVEETTWADLQCAIDDPPGYRNYMTSDHLTDLTDEVIAVIHENAQSLPFGPGWIVLFNWGGAVTRPPSPTPITHREARWVVHPGVFWEDPALDGEVQGWVRSLRQALRPHTTGGVWLNWIGNEGDARVQAAFGDENYRRLRAVKETYDPDNVFRGNHNVAPRD
jgi:FAD/FMN-containing dehydrogenase